MKPLSVGILAVTLTILTATSLAGQQGAEAPHALQEGAWALQFGIGNNFSLGSFGGASSPPSTSRPTAAPCATPFRPSTERH